MPTRRETRGRRIDDEPRTREQHQDEDSYAEDYPDDEYESEDEDDWTDESDEPYDDESDRGQAKSTLAAVAAAKAGLQHIATLTGREPAGVTSLEPSDGGWVVGVEVIEDRRIPSSTDILALYEAKIDDAGGLLGYNRRRRYPRGQGSNGEST